MYDNLYDEIVIPDVQDIVSSYIADVEEFLTYVSYSDSDVRWPPYMKVTDVEFRRYLSIMAGTKRKIHMPCHLVITKNNSVDLLDKINDMIEGRQSSPFIKGLTFKAYVKIHNYVCKLPRSLKILKFGYECKPLEYVKKLFSDKSEYLLGYDGLETLKFGYNFDHSVDNLPESLKTLVFGHGFNHPVDKLPQQLKTLVFGDCFDQAVDKLPESLKTLVFGNVFRNQVDKLPANLEVLKLGHG